MAIGARLRLRSTRNWTISPIATSAPNAKAYRHSVTPRWMVRLSATRPSTAPASTITRLLLTLRGSATSAPIIYASAGPAADPEAPPPLPRLRSS